MRPAVQAPLAGQKHERHPAAPHRRSMSYASERAVSDLGQRHAVDSVIGTPYP